MSANAALTRSQQHLPKEQSGRADTSSNLSTPSHSLAPVSLERRALAIRSPSVAFYPLADGHEGTFQALEAMAKCVRGEVGPDHDGYQSERVREFAEHLVRNVRGQDAIGEISALFAFCKDQIKYLDHALNQQRVQDCLRTIEMETGDCVSKSVCLATLLAALGYEVCFVAQCVDGEEYSHVYCEVLLDDGKWLGLDPVAEDQPIGWRQPLSEVGFETTFKIWD